MSESKNYENLIAGDFDVISKDVTIKTGNNLAKGTVLGKISRALGTTTFSGTGNGAMSGQAMKTKTKNGNYTVKCITAAANGGTFGVFDPNGNRLPDAVVGTPYTSPQIDFSIADGSTDFIVGDTFTIPVLAPTEKYVAVDSTAIDGSNEPEAVLVEDIDATASDKIGVAYLTGEFQKDALIFGGTDVLATHESAMRNKNIFVKVAI